MRNQLLTSLIVVSCVTAALAAQAPASPSPSAATTLTITGCVMQGDTAGGPFILAAPTVVPGTTSTVGTTPNGGPGTQATGTTGTSAPTVNVGAAGPAAIPAPAPPSAVPAPAPSTAVPTATTASSATTPSAPAGFTLSGNDMTPWVGQRVQMVGTVVPATGLGAQKAAATALQEFRVQSVMAIAGSCAQ